MPTLTLTYDTGAVPISRILDSFATRYNWQAIIVDPNNPGTLQNPNLIPNPESKVQFATRMVRLYIVSVVRDIDERNAKAATVDIVMS